IAGGVALRYLAQEAAKLVPVGGSAVAAGVAAAGTWAMGQVAIQYFESGKRLSRGELREAYQRLLSRPEPHFEGEGEGEEALPVGPAVAVPPVPPAPPRPGAPAGADSGRRLRLPFGRDRQD
ncbi:MAG TPA: hypothetical protein VF276_16020, partial [Chloroflexia bacterium]